MPMEIEYGYYDDDDDDVLCDGDCEDFDEEDDACDSVCAICDNGGTLICCEGICLRSFHPTAKDGAPSYCKSLGFTNEEIEEMEGVDFYCKNCQYKQHQCFLCGELGSSDDSSHPEVIKCANGACAYFYHPHCMAKRLHKNETERFTRKFASGEPFVCPLHKCHVCGELEDKSERDLQFAVCRRCPKAYHRKCLPKEISYKGDERKGIVQRAWDDLVPKRALIYCLDHDIVKKIKTPSRNHIKFPDIENDKKRQSSVSPSNKKVVSKKKEDSRKRQGEFSRPESSQKQCRREAMIEDDAYSSMTLREILNRHRSSSSNARQYKNVTSETLDGTLQDKLTSFGRYFTKKDKLQEIVDMLHWYVQGGDTIVDFCCGSNEFSCLMKQKLDEMGKSCSYKNYDIVQTENHFCFQRRDWMEVEPKELPDGAQLIMGLNPPCGDNVDLVNEFINKALEFKPKILVLIAPQDTQRLGDKEVAYDLVWENDQMLSCKSFYLPKSNDEDLDVKPPVLYLWSRPDWTDKHKAIAQHHRHSSEQSQPEDLSDFPDEHHCLDESSAAMDIDSQVDGKNDDSNTKHPRRWKRLRKGPKKNFSGDKSTGKPSISNQSLDRPCISEAGDTCARNEDNSLQDAEVADFSSSCGQEREHPLTSAMQKGPSITESGPTRPSFSFCFYVGPFQPSQNGSAGWLDE